MKLSLLTLDNAIQLNVPEVDKAEFRFVDPRVDEYERRKKVNVEKDEDEELLPRAEIFGSVYFLGRIQ